MSALYLETSAVLRWLFDQSRAREVRAAVDGASAVVTSTLTFAETGRALVRAEQERIVRGADAQKLRGLLQRTCAGWLTMTVSEEILVRVTRPFPVEPVRTLDAIHLATALELTKTFPDLTILSFDERILANATALGIG